ncbi:hypothetical protein BLNAU_8472 [Blattamonas nauphoetae]|uniref:Uncharacterized protein n=1 Tax=Blattamonas nauphoetae TaxID=2049346 RepID=A0ABQ9XYU5_9EUKA|nr:hypothetical protein BLNAU_8472 [Blattamonas nauphoetae]
MCGTTPSPQRGTKIHIGQHHHTTSLPRNRQPSHHSRPSSCIHHPTSLHRQFLPNAPTTDPTLISSSAGHSSLHQHTVVQCVEQTTVSSFCSDAGDVRRRTREQAVGCDFEGWERNPNRSV